MDEHAEKLRFAAAFAKSLKRSGDEAFALLREQLGGDTVRALEASVTWPVDPVVVQEIARIEREGGDDDLMLSRREYGRRLLEEAERAFDAKDRFNFLKLYGEYRGFVENAVILPPAPKTLADFYADATKPESGAA